MNFGVLRKRALFYNKENEGKEQPGHEEEKDTKREIQLAADVAAAVSAADVSTVSDLADRF